MLLCQAVRKGEGFWKSLQKNAFKRFPPRFGAATGPKAFEKAFQPVNISAGGV